MYCRHCGLNVRPVQPPVIPLSRGLKEALAPARLKELLARDLKPIVDEAIYRYGDKPRYPVPAIPVVVEYFRTYWDATGIVVWKMPCEAVVMWVPEITYHEVMTHRRHPYGL